MKKIPFWKYHGLGNDFLVLDLMSDRISEKSLPKLAIALCDRHCGPGADGIVVLKKSRRADGRFDIYNSDGSWAEMSGNGLRIAATYLFRNRTKRRQLIFETAGGLARAEIIKYSPTDSSVKVSLGKPLFATKLIPLRSRRKFHINSPLLVSGTTFRGTALSVGNPHYVIFVDNFAFDWMTLGRQIEFDRQFPRRTNVEFARVINRHKVALNDWERGAGATGSSGTGAAATVVAGVVNGLLERHAEVVFPLGSLFIDWDADSDTIYLTGPVRLVTRGAYFSGIR